MDIEKIIGESKENIRELCKYSIEADNGVNGTMELKYIKSKFCKGTHSVFIYFDLTDSNIMTMAVIKFEDLSMLNKWKVKLKLKKQKELNGYVIETSSTNRRDLVVSFVKKSISESM